MGKHRLGYNNGLSKEKSLDEVALFFRSQLPSEIPTSYPISSMFTSIESEENIRKGVIALLDFMRLFYELLAENGEQYEKPKSLSRIGKMPSLAVDFPFIYHTKSVLLNIGYHGTLSGNALSFCGIKTLATIICCEGMEATTRISVPKLVECITFLNDCGMYFEGFNFDTPKPCTASERLIEVTYPDNPDILVGLKIMAVAQRDLRWKTKDEVFLRCDYRALSSDLKRNPNRCQKR